MDVVWEALTVSDDLVMIKDLKHINDMNNLIKAVDDFKKIMSKAKDAQIDRVEPNPLMKAKGSPDPLI